MVSYTNETKVRDIPSPSMELEIKELLKSAIFDFGADMKKDVFEHSVKRLSYLIGFKYKGLLLGEVKYVFESMSEFVKGKLSVQTIMQLFYKYMDEKIARQKQEIDERDINYEKAAVNCLNNPLGCAIIHKIEMVESGELKTKDWESVPLKQIAQDIHEGKIIVNFKPDRKTKHIWDI
jgi:hypothetical protein